MRENERDTGPTGPNDSLKSGGDPSYEEHVVEPEDALPEVALGELTQSMQSAVARAGWRDLMPVQAMTIPYMMARRDLMIQSRTGSGKTGAFMLPILDRIDPRRTVCQALVLVPTRELARQVTQEAENMSATTGVHIIGVYGGVGYGPQLDAFRQGAHLVVGTPGRLLDHLLRRSLSLEELKILVFDEADRMLSMGFYPDMKQVQRYLPTRRINAYMFSATFPPHVMRLAGEFLHQPQMLSLSRDRVYVAETEHVYYEVPAMEKDRCLVRIIEIENPASAIVFCNTKAMVHYVSVVLKRFGYDADELSADLTQAARERVLQRVRQGNLRFLVATDVAARGIDIVDLSHVFLYEPPDDPDGYIHRAGRTGRAGASGVAISLVAGREQTELFHIGKRFDIDLQHRPLPTDEDVEAIVSERLTSLLEARLRSRDSLQTERMQRFFPLARSLGESEEGSALVAMLLDDNYQATLHAPPPQPTAAEPSRAAGEPPARVRKKGPRGRSGRKGRGRR
ncbi:MAG: DEAD/DEAH box helicase [candidate division Zixibacteria bacterium]|nr:DEAD/DEAH box helicase [candidate division Zixibacteria bacterium]